MTPEGSKLVPKSKRFKVDKDVELALKKLEHEVNLKIFHFYTGR